MQIDMNAVFSQMKDAIKFEVREGWQQAKSGTASFFQKRAERMEMMANMRIQNKVTEEFFQERLLDERDILASELHTISMVSKVASQNAANAAIDVLEKAIKNAARVW